MFHGSLVAIITPMRTDGTVDFPALSKLIEWHIQEGTDGLVVLGSTGESVTIEADERRQIVENVIHQVNGRLPVIIGTGSNSTQHAIHLTQEAMELGADAALLVVPYYNKPTQEGMYQHFKAIATAVPLPQILYNVPSRTICDLLPETILRLTEFNNIIGVKEATGDLSRIAKLKASLDLYSGDDNTAADFMLAGGKGWITVVGNIVPKLTHKLAAAASAGDKLKTDHYAQQLKPLLDSLSAETNPIPVKWALKELGWVESGIRLPLTCLSEQYRAKIRQSLVDVGAL